MAQTQEQLGGIHSYIQKLKRFTRNAWMVLIFSTLTGAVFGVFRLLFNFYVLSLGGYDERFLGTLTSVSSAASLVAAIPAAYLADRFSQKRVLLVAGFIGALALLGLVLMPYRPFLIGFNILNGLTQSLYMVTISPFLMRNTTEDERLYVFSLNFGFRTLAGFVGNMFGGLLPMWLGGMVGASPTDTPAYQLALGTMTLVSLLSIIPIAFIRMLPPDPDQQLEMPWTLMARHSRALTRIILPNLVIGLGAGLMMPFMNLYFRNVFDQPDAVIGWLFGLDAVAMTITQFIAAPLADRIGKISTVVLTEALSVPFLITLGLAAWVVPTGRGSISTWFAIAAVAYLFRVGLMNLGNPVYQTFVMEYVQPEVQALAASFTSISFQLGWVFSPNLSGWFQATYGELGFVPVFLTTSVFYIVSIIMTWAFFRNAEKLARATIQAASSTAGES
jgi:MFS family permease